MPSPATRPVCSVLNWQTRSANPSLLTSCPEGLHMARLASSPLWPKVSEAGSTWATASNVDVDKRATGILPEAFGLMVAGACAGDHQPKRFWQNSCGHFV